MKNLGLVAIVLLAGCSAGNTYTGDTDPRLAGLEARRQTIAGREKQCIDEALNRITGTADSIESQTQIESAKRDREIANCRLEADQQNAEISAQERDEYELQAEEERHRASLMMILTTSQPR